MTYTIKAIPTTYAGVNFRSRLEARWAAFFDLCGWKWDYEPFDLDGWAPDFLLKGKTRALIEVKPIEFEPSAARFDDQLRLITLAKTQATKAFRAAERGDCGAFAEVIVIGLGPFCYESGSGWGFGVMASESWGGQDVAVLWDGYDRRLDYSADEGSFAYRIGGQHSGDHHLRPVKGDAPRELWREAGNIVQWNARKSA